MHKNTDGAGVAFSFRLCGSASPGIFLQLTSSTQTVNKPQTAKCERAREPGWRDDRHVRTGQPGQLDWYFGAMETPLHICPVWVSAPQGWPHLMSGFTSLLRDRETTWLCEPAWVISCCLATILSCSFPPLQAGCEMLGRCAQGSAPSLATSQAHTKTRPRCTCCIWRSYPWGRKHNVKI